MTPSTGVSENGSNVLSDRRMKSGFSSRVLFIMTGVFTSADLPTYEISGISSKVGALGDVREPRDGGEGETNDCGGLRAVKSGPRRLSRQSGCGRRRPPLMRCDEL
ncbi:hypothetical protein EYF80_018320 [Liparis tanakae]|uniref:Uncharacterized protein n=1 Tax=Liparis tanakae TaxID=230148 RepID=A0A4Z2I0C2_9TELE|nr:hypothetical protein EYF80_018320 [Liparis tanakae]